jgi:hypothetical protein
VIVCAVGGWRLDRTWLALGTAFVLLTPADNVCVIESVTGVWTPGGYNDFTYSTALVLLAFAAWTPRGREIAADPAGVRAAVFPIGCAVVAVAIEATDELLEFNMVTSLLTSVSIAAIVARLTVTLGGCRAIIASSRRDAMTDPITGLGNRRRLLADLDSALAELPSPFAIGCRPRRVQGLQRLVRPCGGRRPARAHGHTARGRYPDRLAGEAIPLGARIIAAATRSSR